MKEELINAVLNNDIEEISKVIAKHEENLADCIDEMLKKAVEEREIIEIK